MFCLSDFKQLNFFDQVSELNTLSFQKPVKFVELLKEHFDLKAFIPESFSKNYYSSLGSDRDYQLHSVLAAFFIMHIFNIPTTTLLCIFLSFSTYLQDFYQFTDKIPDETFFSRFKTSFENDIAIMFESMIPHILDICSQIDNNLPQGSPHKGFSTSVIYDTSGLKPKVKENNPKTLVSQINKQKVFAKTINNEKFNPYAAAYKNMPKQAECNPDIKLDFVNGHFGYFYKFGILTNGLGIPLRLHFFDDAFYSSVKVDFDTPQDQKYAFDNASLKPVLKPFLESFPNHGFNTFLGDSEFDSYDNYGFLKSLNFEKVLIPINPRNSKKPDTTSIIKVNHEGTPLCPLTGEEFLPDGSCKGKKRSFRLKYICCKSKRINGKLICQCQTPCRRTKSTVTVYKYPHKDFRLYPGIQRCSKDWDSKYKTRAVIERSIASLKKNPSIEAPRTVNTASMRSDLYLAGISKLITVLLAYSINKPQYICSIRKIMRLVA